VHRDPRHLAVDKLAFARMQAGTHLEAELAHRIRDRARAADRSRRSVEAREEPSPTASTSTPRYLSNCRRTTS
jgi:hypothetical protein